MFRFLAIIAILAGYAAMSAIKDYIRRGATAFGFLKAWNTNRKAKRDARRAKREGPLPDDRGEFFTDDKETPMTLDLGTRTSTNALIGGTILSQLYVQVVTLIPGEGALEALLLQPESIAFFAVLLAAIVARFSRTPAVPGKL